MNIPPFLLDGRRFIFQGANSVQVSLINYTFNSSDYDDVLTQTLTGSVVTSGLVFPVRGKFGSTESMLMEQGKLKLNDKILFLTGDTQLNTSGLVIGIGSPIVYYSVLQDGIHSYEVIISVFEQLKLKYLFLTVINFHNGCLFSKLEVSFIILILFILVKNSWTNYRR